MHVLKRGAAQAAAFLWAAPAEQAALVPRVTSHGYRTVTLDPSP